MHVIFAIITGALSAFAIVRISACSKQGPPCPRLTIKQLLVPIVAIIGAIVYIELTKLGYGAIKEGIQFINIQIASVAPALAIYGIFCPY